MTSFQFVTFIHEKTFRVEERVITLSVVHVHTLSLSPGVLNTGFNLIFHTFYILLP